MWKHVMNHHSFYLRQKRTEGTRQKVRKGDKVAVKRQGTGKLKSHFHFSLHKSNSLIVVFIRSLPFSVI